jgi:hypothetical protein
MSNPMPNKKPMTAGTTAHLVSPFIVNLTWKFNEARSKYRGSGAGEKQKARM